MSDLDDLFPAPSLPPSQLCPQRLPGTTADTLATLLDVLKDNHQRYHIFHNDTRFHNHISHRVLAIHALGGSAAIIRDYYDRDRVVQRPPVQSPAPITEENFVDHLEDENYYQGYVAFFINQITKKGFSRTLEEYVFSEKYNFQDGRSPDKQPEMLARFMDGVVHPMIHIGNAVEFGLKGMLAEGLALAAVHVAYPNANLPRSYFASDSTDPIDRLASRLSPLVLDDASHTKAKGVHVFDILARLLKEDSVLRQPSEDINKQFRDTLNESVATIWGHVQKWTIDLDRPGEIERKMEEAIWLSCVVYSIGSLRSSGFQADFFYMHMVTSSIFLSSLLSYLSPLSQVLLLRSYVYTVFVWWIARGRPPLNIKAFMTTTPLEPPVSISPPSKTPHTTETTPIPNPFLPILQSAMTHTNDHVSKLQRALAHYNVLYGRRPAGYFKDTELEGAELLDGSLFLRAALLTMDYVGWIREGGVPKLVDVEPRLFSFEGFFQ